MHMSTYFDVLFFSLIGGLFSLVGGALLLRRERSALALAKYATPFAAGSLLAAVFLDLLPEGIEIGATDEVFIATLVGIIIFFIGERFLHWFHHHHQHGDSPNPTTSLIIVGDSVHNALDGVVIAAAFLVSPTAGVITTIAVAAHEIPQEIGDFGLLLHKGMKRGKVLLVNALSALFTTVAALITFSLGSEDRLPLGVLIGISAGFLLYIAMSDVIPELHERASSKRVFDLQPILLIAGIVVVGIMVHILHGYLEH